MQANHPQAARKAGPGLIMAQCYFFNKRRKVREAQGPLTLRPKRLCLNWQQPKPGYQR
jgi:hypothetical protein